MEDEGCPWRSFRDPAGRGRAGLPLACPERTLSQEATKLKSPLGVGVPEAEVETNIHVQFIKEVLVGEVRRKVGEASEVGEEVK